MVRVALTLVRVLQVYAAAVESAQRYVEWDPNPETRKQAQELLDAAQVRHCAGGLPRVVVSKPLLCP